MATVLVTGGTGVLGRDVVARLKEAGHQVRVLSRRGEGTDVVRGDLSTGEGLVAALNGVSVVVHAASHPMHHKTVDVAGTRRLVDAAGTAGVDHVLYVSIVGVDRIPYSYYRSKLQAEAIIERSGIGCTVQRATQFHDLVLRAVEALSRLPWVFLPSGVRVQPVDTRDVADRIAQLVASGPAGRAPDLGGPDVLTAPEAARMCMDALGRQRKIVEVNLPGATMRAIRAGDHLTPSHADGRHDLGEYLARKIHKGHDGKVDVDLPYARR